MKDLEGQWFMNILLRAVGPERAQTAREAFFAPPSVSIRVNPSKVSDAEAFVREHFSESAEAVPWNSQGYILSSRPRFTLDPLFHAGCYYVQDSSAMAVGSIFRKILDRHDCGRPLRVLDLCAAPGGKTTDMAASLRQARGDGFILVANEVMRSRAGILADNVALWGDPNVVVTSQDPKAFGRMEGFFDIIVADVPCSGEGMFRKDRKAVEDWSEDAVSLCAARQKRILADVWPSLRKGGTLVYSTCTFEEAENDANMEWAATELGAEVIDCEYSSLPGAILSRTGAMLVPGFVKGEGQFVAALEKTSGAGSMTLGKHAGKETSRGDIERIVPDAIACEVKALETLHPIQTCVLKGVRKGKDFVPSADLALSICLRESDFPRAELDLKDALKFLRRDSIFIKDAPEGYVVVCFEGHPLGFVKNLGSRCNNLHPQGRRIRTEAVRAEDA